MDPELLSASIGVNGAKLIPALQQQQGDSALSGLGPYINKILVTSLLHNRNTGSEWPQKVVDFVASKADMLFKTENANPPLNIPPRNEEGFLAITPPLETLLDIPEEDRRKHFYKTIAKGDTVLGVISGKQTIGFTITIQCTDGTLVRDIRDCGIKAFCPASSAISSSVYEDPIDYYQVKDLIRTVVMDVDAEEEKLTVSMQEKDLPEELQLITRVGLVSEDEYPPYYRVLLKLRAESYEDVLKSSLGFMNPLSVAHMCEQIGFQDQIQPSFKYTPTK